MSAVERPTDGPDTALPGPGDVIHLPAVATDDTGEIVSVDVQVQRVTRMHCGCDRIEALRPGGWPTTWPWPLVAVVTPGCGVTGCAPEFEWWRPGDGRADETGAQGALWEAA